MYDVIIIGAGVVGSAIARELAKTNRKIAVLEKESDLCEGTSKANSGIVHAGFDAKPGTLKAKLNVRGSKMMEKLSKTLDFSYKRNGAFVLCFEESGQETLQNLLQQAKENGVEGVSLLTKDRVREMEPSVSEQVLAALYAPTSAIVCPFEMNLAFAENAWENGVSFYFNTEVEKITQTEEGFEIITNQGTYESRLVVNAAGVYADQIHNMIHEQKMTIIPRRGEYCLMDKSVGQQISHTLFQLPTNLGKGVLVTPTVHGNLLVGPTAEDMEERENTDTTAAGMENVLQTGAKSIEKMPLDAVITSFAGVRAHEAKGDFIIEESEEVKGFFDVAGIASPGLSAAPAIGEYVAALIQREYPATKNDFYKRTRRGIPHFAKMTYEERERLIQENSSFSEIVCRCEMVTLGEILAAIHRPLGATTLDGVKRRVRAGMGRCQGGFCSPKVVEILSNELKLSKEEITKCGKGSYFLTGDNKGGVCHADEKN